MCDQPENDVIHRYMRTDVLVHALEASCVCDDAAFSLNWSEESEELLLISPGLKVRLSSSRTRQTEPS